MQQRSTAVLHEHSLFLQETAANKRKVRILIVGARSIAAGEGGVEKFAEEFANRLPEHCQATILCLDGRRGRHSDRVEIVHVPSWDAFNTDKALYFTHSLYLYAVRPYDCVLIL